MNLTQYTIREGDQSTLRWDSANVSSVYIDNGIGNVGQNGSRTVAPRSGIYTYQGTFTGYNGQTITCLATLRVDGYRTGGHGPNVTLNQLPNVEALPLTSLYLADLPYTGLDLGPGGTMLYWLVLIIWSLALAYLIFWSIVPLAYKRVAVSGTTTHTRPVAHATAHVEHNPTPKVSAYEGFKASVAGGALTIDDIVNGLARQASDEHALPPSPEDHTWKTPAEVLAAAPVAKVVSHDVPAFLTALLAAEKDQVFNIIREINKAGGDVEQFLTHAVMALDDAYRAKIDGTAVHPDVARVCVNCAPSFLERVISSLSTAVDGSYTTGVTGVKLALTRALQAVEG
jgi:hypothetical protein